MTTCRECGQRVSTEATQCPKCGCPDPAIVPDEDGPARHDGADKWAAKVAQLEEEAEGKRLNLPNEWMVIGAGLLVATSIVLLLAVFAIGSKGFPMTVNRCAAAGPDDAAYWRRTGSHCRAGRRAGFVGRPWAACLPAKTSLFMFGSRPGRAVRPSRRSSTRASSGGLPALC